MNRTSLIIILLILGMLILACKKKTQPLTADKPAIPGFVLEDNWWKNSARPEYILFQSTGRFHYIKGDVPTLDTNHSSTKGNWHWLNGDTLTISHEGVMQGTCVRKLSNSGSADTLMLYFTAGLPSYNSVIWLK